MNKENTLRLGTRKSQLALAQAQMVAQALRENQPGISVELVEIVTTGDRKQSTQALRDKKEWILEIEEALLRNEVDFAVHSGKDVPAEVHTDTVLLPVLKRGNPFDALIARDSLINQKPCSLLSLRQGAIIGTSSLRRRAQLLRLRPDLEVVTLRGNVSTRVAKLREGNNLDGLVLASAGLERLALDKIVSQNFSLEQMLPAVNQGMLIVQWRRTRADLEAIFEPLVDKELFLVWQAERGFISELGADCHSAVSVYGEVKDQEIFLRGQVFSADGGRCVEGELRTSALEAPATGRRLAKELLGRGAGELLGGENVP